MKYVAILKDSLRETIDGKVFLVMLVLSFLAMLLTASLSFVPEPAEQGVKTMTQQFDRFIDFTFDQQMAVSYEIEEFEQTNQATRPWNGEYRFQLVAQDGKKLPFKALVMILEASGRIGGSRGERQLSEQGRADRDELNKILQEASAKPPEEQQKYLEAKLQQKLDRVKPEQLEGFIREQFAERGNLEVTSVKLLNQEGASGRYRFQVEARGRANTFNLWPHTLGLFFGATDTGVKLPIGPLVLLIESYAVGYAGAAIFLLVSSVMTSFFIPNMLRKGTVDLLISKPIRRWMLLLYKYVGGLLFMFLNTVVLIGGFWLVMGMRTGLWGPSFLLMIPILTFQFAIFYAVSTLAAVLTRNTIVAIMATAMFWAALFVAGQAFAWSGPSPGKEASTFHKGAKIVYKMLPRVRDMDKLSQYVIAVDLLQSDNKQRAELSAEVDNTSWAETVIVSVIFVALLLGASCWWFSSKDY